MASSAIVSATTNVTIATATGLVGVAGPAAVAGYGTGARLEYLLVPIVFGVGAPLAAMVGTAMGAGDLARARRAAWTGAIMAGVLTGSVGLGAALWPEAWLGLFGEDRAMLAIGTQYLRIVGPTYGLFGVGLALYFAAQARGRSGGLSQRDCCGRPSPSGEACSPYISASDPWACSSPWGSASPCWLQ